jgi:hypothetical protein
MAQPGQLSGMTLIDLSRILAGPYSWWLPIIGAPARNHREFRLTLGEIIGRVWLTLGDPRLTIIETGLHASAPAHAILSYR